MDMIRFVIHPDGAEKRLDVFLKKQFSASSRSYIQRLITKGIVSVNKKAAVKPAYILKSQDIVTCRIEKTVPALKPSSSPKLDIIYEDNDIIVLNKSAGILVHPAKNEYRNTLVNALLNRFPSLKDVGEDAMRPGIVHRLDRDTSGIMVVAKNNEAFRWLKKQFQERRVEKTYLALVHGTPEKKQGYTRSSIGKLKGKQVTGNAIQKLGLKSREAFTEYKTLKEFLEYTLLEVIPRTGRTHQIRVHLSSIGHPIVGDPLYKFKRLKSPTGIKRQFLHAYSLKFSMPNNRVFEFTAELPGDLKRALTLLKKEG